MVVQYQVLQGVIVYGGNEINGKDIDWIYIFCLCYQYVGNGEGDDFDYFEDINDIEYNNFGR